MRLVLTVPLVGLAVLAAAPAGHASVTATLSAGQLEVRMTAPHDEATIVRSGTSITVAGTGSATTAWLGSDVSAVAFLDVSGAGTVATIDLSGGRVIGAGRPATVDLGAGPATDVLRVLGEPGGDKIAVGSAGLNVTAAEDSAVDIASPLGVDRWVLEGRGGGDLLSAGGGYGTGGPVAVPVEIVAGAGGGLYSGGAADDVVRGAEGNDRLYGGAGNDWIAGGGGSDHVAAGLGDDSIENGPEADVLEGDGGRDRLLHSGIGGAVDIDLARAIEGAGSAGADQIGGVEILVGTPFADRLAGNQGSNQLLGGPGDDVLTGGGGDDLVDGGEGDDRLSGDSGRDIVTGGPGRDEAGYASSPGGVSVILTPGGGGSSSAAAGIDALAGIEDVSGSSHNDLLKGNDSGNRLAGGAGNDDLIGGAGPDIIKGGADDDMIESADATADEVACGTGKDLVDADAEDRVDDDCEARGKRKVKRRKRTGGGAPQDETQAIKVLGLAYRGRAGNMRVVVRLQCPATARFACRGNVRLKTQVRADDRVRRRRAAQRKQFKTILSGRTGRVALRLWPAARRSVEGTRRRVKLVVLVTARDGRRTDISARVVRRAACAPTRTARRCVKAR